jgi:hypothetical protein
MLVVIDASFIHYALLCVRANTACPSIGLTTWTDALTSRPSIIGIIQHHHGDLHLLPQNDLIVTLSLDSPHEIK